MGHPNFGDVSQPRRVRIGIISFVATLLNSDSEGVRRDLALFSGGTGGIDSWLTADRSEVVCSRLARLAVDPLSCSQLNQLLALSHLAEVSDGFFKYYWNSESPCPYEVTSLPWYHETFAKVGQILSLDQLRWGLYRFYTDCLLFYGTIQIGYRELRTKDLATLVKLNSSRRYDTEMMLHRGPAIALGDIARDDRYLIAEQACKSFDPPEGEERDLLMVLKGAWHKHIEAGGGRIKTKELLEGAYVLHGYGERKQQFLFAADDILDSDVVSEEDLIAKYEAVRQVFSRSREVALQNTGLYLSMANDLDVYVATSMRTRQQFREMAQVCDVIFAHPAVRYLNLRYFDPTISAARGHEDKGLIECLMVKCAKVLIYNAGDRDSYGKDAEAAMALSQGKPVVFLCDEEDRRLFFSDVHPLSRLIDFQTGVVVGADSEGCRSAFRTDVDHDSEVMPISVPNGSRSVLRL